MLYLASGLGTFRVKRFVADTPRSRNELLAWLLFLATAFGKFVSSGRHQGFFMCQGLGGIRFWLGEKKIDRPNQASAVACTLLVLASMLSSKVN
jgi:hypothetical protein